MRKIRLKDLDAIDYKNKRLAFYRARTKSALADENKNNPSDELLSALCEISWKLEQGAPPSIDSIMTRYARPLLDRITKDEKCIDNAMIKLMSALEESSPLVLEDIKLKMTDKGFSPEHFNEFLSALTDIVKENANIKNRQPAKQGNVKLLSTVWTLEMWPLLKEIGLTMKGASRVIAKIFNGDANSEKIYQSIRNNKTW